MFRFGAERGSAGCAGPAADAATAPLPFPPVPDAGSDAAWWEGARRKRRDRWQKRKPCIPADAHAKEGVQTVRQKMIVCWKPHQRKGTVGRIAVTRDLRPNEMRKCFPAPSPTPRRAGLRKMQIREKKPPSWPMREERGKKH